MGNKKKLYDNLIKSGRLTVEDIGDFATFDSITNNPESIGKLYSNLRKDDLFTEEELGDGATFASMLAVEPPVEEVVAPQPMQDQTGSPLVSTPEREFVAPGEVSPAKVEEIKAEKEKEIKNIGAGREAIMGSVTDPVEKEVLGYALDATEKEYVTRGGMTPLQKMAEFSKRMKVIDDSMNEEAISQLDQAGIDALEAEYEKMAKSNAYELGLDVKPDGSVKPFDREMDAYMEKVDFHVRLKAGEKEEAGKAGLGKQMANKLAAGISSFTANTLDTFGFVTGANYFEGYKKLHEGQRYRVDQYRSAANRYDQNIQSYVEQGNLGAAAAVTVGSALESLPAMIPIFLHPTSGLYVMSAGAGMEKFREIENADIPEWKKYYNSFLTAANEYAGEKLVTIPILKRSREAVLRLGEKSGREAIVNATKSVIRDKAAIPSLPEWVKEGGSEVFTTLGNDIADKVTVSPEKKIGATFFDDFVVGSLMGKIFSLPQDISNMRDRESARKFAKEVLEKLPSDMDIETKIELGWLLVERGALEEKENKLADEFKGKYAPRIEEINKKVQSISNKYLGIEVAPPTIKKEAPVAPVSEEQSKVDYLKSRGQVVPDGTDMKTLEEMFSAEKTKERTEVNTEIDTKVKKAQEELGLPDVPNIEISEDTEATLDRLDEGLPVTNEYIESASQELYDRYRELEAMKSSDTRLYTTEQIDDMQGYLGEEIERLENYASEQKETGEFVGEVKGGEVAEGKAEGVAEGVREEVKEEPVQKPEMPVEAVSPKAEQVAPTEEKVAVKAADEVVVSPSNVKQQQFDVIQQSNPITDDVHTGIRKVEDIKTAEEVFSESISKNEGATPDFTADDMKSALESGEITVYSSKEIADGVFVTPSKMEAKSYAGKGKVYSKKVALADVAWVDNVEGQYAKVKLVKEEKKESDDKKTKRRLQRVDKQPAADGKPIVGKGETSPQGARLVDGAVVKAGDEVFYNGEKRKVKAVKGDVLTIPGVGDVHKSKVLSSAKIVPDKRPLDLNDKNPDNVNDDLLSDEVFDRIRKQNIEPTDVEVLSTAALAKSLMNGDISADAAIDAAVSRFADRGTVPDHVPFFKAAPGAKYTSPYATYNDAVRGADNAGKNLWVRNTPFSTNKQRVLLVQFSSNFLYGKQPFKRDKESSYFDKLYRLVAGYNRTVDFWEVPLWIARIAGLQRNADVYVIRDIEEAKKFISEAGYASVHFSALDVNEKHIVDVIQSTPGVKYQIGGYTDFKRIEALPDVTVYKSIDEYVEKNKLIDIDSPYSYRHFKGTAVIPRLKLSEGCLYKCAFCSIPKKVIPVKKEWIDSQIESIKDLDATLVYLDDKTFGQAENYTLLPELYERIKEYNPDFKGFIVQTTALDFANKKKFGTEYLKNSHIQFVELGVETYNDDILTKLNKRHSHKKFVDAAMENARENNIKVIPNIIVGLSWNEGTKEKPVIKTETKETYQNTLDFLENNKDVISHVNIYSLALYEGTELSDAIEVKEEADKNENIIAKSWQQNKEDHVWAMNEFSDFASNQIKEEKKDEVQKEEKGLRDEKVNARFKKIAKQTGTDVETVTKMYDTLMSVFGLSQDKALAAAVIVDRMVDTMAKRRNKTKADIYASIKWEKGGATAVTTGIKQDVLGKAQGAVTFLSDATAVIQALTNPNVTTPMHELAHVFEKYLTAKEKESVLKWTNEKSWSTNTSESFARGFERFLYDGTAPANLKSIFQKFAAWLRDIYKSITLSEIKLDLNDDMQKIYSAMLGAEYKGEVIKEAAPVAETTAESEADAFFGNLAVDENGVTVLSDEEIADDFFSKLEVDENGYTLLQMIGTVGAARLDAAENNNRRIFNLREAMKMTDANKTAEEIKLATGWEKGKDKRWRYEIPPTMKIKKAWDKLGVSALDNKQELSITEALDYPELFAAYPELEKIKIRKDKAFLDIFQSVQGWYDSDNMELVVAPHAIDPFGTILHELQHAVQMVEGFAAGANTDSVIEAIPDFEFENVVDQIVEKLERDIKKNTQKNLDRRKILSEMTSQEEADIRRYSKEIIAAKEEGDRIYKEEKDKFPDKNPYKDNKRLLELTEVKTDLRSKINDIIERIIGERSIPIAIEFAYGIEAVEEVIEETTNKIIEDNKSVRVIKSGADRKTIIDNFRPSIGDMAYNYYKRVAGETEARNVAVRAKLTPEQRKSTAESTEDIPREQQIVMRNGKIVSMDMGAMTVTVDGKKRPVLNSEGRPIHNTEEGIINFWKWFGDSKVVDAQGRPLVVYHGQPPIYDSKNGYKRIEPEQITEFSNEKRRFLREGDVGFYFTPNKKDATDYAEGGSVYSLYIRSDNPILWKTEYHYDGIPGLPKIKSFTFLPKNSVNDIISAGYDGIMSISGSDVVGYNGEVVVFSSAQIKSATGNVGTFSGTTPNILFEQPLTNREMAVRALANLAKNETTAEGARARIVAYLASRGRRLGIDEGNIISDAISRLGLSEAVVEPVRRAPSNPVPGERLPEPVGGKTKKSKLGLRLISGHSAIPEEVKRLIENNRLHEYRVLSHEEGQRIAKELYDENGLIDSYNAFFNTRMHSALEVYFGANIIMGMKKEIEQAEKEGRIADADYWSDQLVDFSGKYIKQVSVERAQGLNALGSAFIQSLFPSRAFVRKYIMGVNDARAEVLNSKPFKKKAERAKKEFEEERNAVVKTVIDELEEKVKKIKGGASLRELMSEKNRLLKELELRRKGKTKMQLSVPSIPGLDPVEVAYGVEFASLYIQGGVYGEKLIDRLIKDFGKIGIDLTEEQAEQMIPERMMVNGVEVDTRDVIEANEMAKAAKRLANRIFGSVIEKKESADPLTVMLNTLMSKFNERNIKKPGSLKVPVIDKIAEAIKNKAMYADIWLQAKEKALSIIENNEKLSEEEKTRAKQLVKDSYDNATKFTFTEKQIDEAIKGKMKELNIVIRDIVSAHFDVRSQHMGTITNALIIDADLTEEEAKELGEAINRRYNTLMAERGKKLLERYTKHLTKEQRVNTTRKKDEDRLLELINIGAFNDPEFVTAFANARGMKKIDPEEIKAIEAKAEEVQRQKSPKIRARKLEDLLGYMAKIEGVTLSDKLEALWFAQVLGRIPTQLRNMIGAGTGVGADAATMLITNPVDAIPSTLNSLRRAFTFGKNSAGDVIRNGYTSYIQKVEVPRVAEFLHMNPEKFYKFARFIPFYWNHMKYVSRVMGANDVFFMTTAKEVWADVLTRRGVLIDGKKYSRYKYLFDGEYRDAVEQIVKEKLFITKEQMDAIKAEVAADAITYGYTTSDMKIATMEAIDMLRPADLVETATWLASTATGNVPTYGTLGFLTDRLAETLKNIGLRRPQKTESGDYIWVKWRPFYYAATFTKITSNVVSRMMEFVPGLGIMRWASGSVGFFYKDEYFLGANSNKFARYYRELSKEERVAVGRRQIIGALFTLAMYFLSDPGDDDDPLVRITANGTGDYAKNKSLDKADWKEYSIGIKSGEGRIWIPYKLTPLALVLAPLGWMRDKKRHNKKYENVPDAAMFLKGLQWMPYFIGDITAIMSMNEVLNGLFSEKSMRDLNAFVDDGEIAVSDKSKSFVQGFLNNIVKSFTPTLKGFYTPMLYPDIVKMWEWWTERELDMEKNEFKRLVNLFPTMAFSNKDEGMIYMDVLGRESKRPFFLSEFFDFKKSDDILVYHAKNADQLPATQWGSKMFDIYEGNNLIPRTLDPTDKKDEELMWYYSKRRAEYLLKGVDSNEGYIMGMEALKAYGITGDLYQESVKKLDYAAQQAAKKDVTDVSMYELEFLRTQIGR